MTQAIGKRTIDLGSETLVKASRPVIPGLPPELQPSRQSIYRAIRSGKLASLRLPGVGLVTSLEALAEYSRLAGGGNGAVEAAPPRKSLKRRLEEREERTRRIFAQVGL